MTSTQPNRRVDQINLDGAEPIKNEDNFDEKLGEDEHGRTTRDRLSEDAREQREELKRKVMFIHEKFGVDIYRKSTHNRVLFADIVEELYIEHEKDVVTFAGYRERVVFEDGELFYTLEITRDLRVILEEFDIGTKEELDSLKSFEVDEAEYEEEKEERTELIHYRKRYLELRKEAREVVGGVLPVVSEAIKYVKENIYDIVPSVTYFSYKAGRTVFDFNYDIFKKELNKHFNVTASLFKEGKDMLTNPKNTVNWAARGGFSLASKTVNSPFRLYNYLTKPYFGPENRPYFGPFNESQDEKRKREKDERVTNKIINEFQEGRDTVKKIVTDKKEEIVEYLNLFGILEKLGAILEQAKRVVATLVKYIILVLVLLIVYKIVS